MRISRREFASGIAGIAALGSAMAQPAGLLDQSIVERRTYALGSALPPPEILHRNGIRTGSTTLTENGTVYLIRFNTLEERVKAWDRFNTDEDWCVIRDAGRVALEEIRVYASF